MYAITVRPDNTGAEIELPTDDGSGQQTMDALYREIGCRYVEAVQLAPDLYMWADEEGTFADAPVPNRGASLVGAAFDRGYQFVGTVVFTGGADDNGNTQALSSTRARWLRTQLETMGVTL